MKDTRHWPAHYGRSRTTWWRGVRLARYLQHRFKVKLLPSKIVTRMRKLNPLLEDFLPWWTGSPTRQIFRHGLVLRSLCAGATALLLAMPGHALSPNLRLSQFYHTAWTAKEGAPTNVYALVQTAEGYLWMGGSAGLFR